MQVDMNLKNNRLRFNIDGYFKVNSKRFKHDNSQFCTYTGSTGGILPMIYEGTLYQIHSASEKTLKGHEQLNKVNLQYKSHDYEP
jgi:hypothetical protein